MARGLWKYVDGSATLPDEPSADARAKFESESQKAFSTIVLSVSTTQLYLITTCEEPKDAWDTLKKHFERQTLANKLFLKKQYFRKEMKEGTPIDVHLKDMKELTDKLASIGAPIAEEDQVVTLLGSLPQSYSTIVTALETHGEDITLDFVQESLINHERKLKSNTLNPEASSGAPQDSALVGASQ